MATKKWIGGTNNSANDLSVASNYSPSGVPANGDDLYIEGQGTDYSIIAGLQTFGSVTLNSLNIANTYTGTIGLTNTGTSSTTTGYMSLGGTNTSAITINIGYQPGGTQLGSGSPLVRLNLGSMRGTVNITNSATNSLMPNAGPVTLLGSHTSNTLNIVSGTASVAADPTETSNFATINNRGNLSLGIGVTLTTINQNGGYVSVRSGLTTFNQTAGVSTFTGNGTVSAMNLQGGSAALNSTGTITTLNVYGAIANFSGSPNSRTVTTVTLYAGATLNLNNGVKNSITITNPIAVQAGPGQFTITGWYGSSFTLS